MIINNGKLIQGWITFMAYYLSCSSTHLRHALNDCALVLIGYNKKKAFLLHFRSQVIGLYCRWHLWERGFFWKMSSLSFLFEATSSCSRDICTLPAPSTVQWFVTHFKSWSRISANAAIILKDLKKKGNSEVSEKKEQRNTLNIFLSPLVYSCPFLTFRRAFPPTPFFLLLPLSSSLPSFVYFRQTYLNIQ